MSDNTLSLSTYSPEAKALVNSAQQFADDSKCKWFDPAHLLAVLLDVADISSLLKGLPVSTVAFSSQLHHYLSQQPKGEETSSLHPTTVELLNRGKTNVEKRPVNAFDLLYALSQEKQGITANLFRQFDISPEKCFTALNAGKERDIDTSPYLTNLSLAAKKEKFEPIIGRDDEVRRLIQILGRRAKNHPLLVGESGVGKRTIVLAFVDRIINSQVPKNFRETMVVQLNTQNLLAGVKSRVDVETRIKQILKFLVGHNAVLYIRSLESLLAPGLNLNLHDLFTSMFECEGLRVITSISPDGLKKLSEKEGNLLKEFTQLTVEPCSADCAVEILRGIAGRYEKHHNIRIGEAAISTTVKLAKRYVQNRFLPESAVDLLDEAASNKMMEVNGIPAKMDKVRSRVVSLKAQITGLSSNSDEVSCKARHQLEKEMEGLDNQFNIDLPQIKAGEAFLTEESIADVLSSWTNIPAAKFLEGDADKLSHMEEKLTARVVGQDEAVNAVSKSVRRSYLGLRDPVKPIGSFLFLGSSGVGKTEIAKALAEFLFDDEQAMIRVDCSELQERHNAAKLIGSPPGYQGSEEGGMLTEAVRKRPYSVLLFDEVEKAHPDVFNLLLQVLDDGRLTDSRGRTADFSNTIVIMTSNIGSKKILDTDKNVFASEEGRAAIKEMLHNEVKNFLRPEFINRIDETVIFRPLAVEQLSSIFNIQLNCLHRMLGDRNITIKVSKEAQEKLVSMSYQPAYGARPLKRAILKHIQDPLAEMMVKGHTTNGSTVRVFCKKGELAMEPMEQY